MIHMIKKDLMIMGIKNLMFSLSVPILFTLFVQFVHRDSLGVAALFLSVLMTFFIVNQVIDIAENKYVNAFSLLCCTPFKRKTFVYARYTLNYLIYAYSFMVYIFLGVLVLKASPIDLTQLLVSFSIVSYIISIYLPIKYKFGLNGTKYVSIIFILFVGLAFGLISKYKPVLSSLSPIPALSILLIFTISVNLTSIYLSVYLLEKREL